MTKIYSEEDRYSIFARELLEWNKKFNLTSITDPEEINTKHFEDSLTLSEAFDFSTGAPRVIDIGAGAGFPGIPLKIRYPNILLTLVDSVKKKTEFMTHSVDVLGLKDVDVVWGRAEDLASGTHGREGMREAYDVAVTRALADLALAGELCLPFVKTGGIFIAMKSGDIADELTGSEKALEILGGKVSGVIDVSIGSSGGGQAIARKLVVVSKLSGTPVKYPRKAGIPQKRPLK